MADNFVTDPGAAGAEFVSREISHSSDTVQLSGAFIMGISGTEGAYTAVAINGDATNGLDVDVTRVSGTVTVDSGGTFTVQEDGAALTSLQLLDDTVATLGTDTYTEATTKGNVIGAVRNDALAALADTDNEFAPFQVNADGALYVHSPNKISTDNSSTDTLASGIAFTGTGEDVSQHSVVTVTIDASHDSATDGMVFQLSTDDSNWDDTGYTFTYTAADGARRFQFPVTAQFFRVVYTNGGTNQTHFRLQTILHDNATLTTIHRLVDDMDPDRSAEVVKSVLFAQANGSGNFAPIQSTGGGNLKVSIEEFSNGVDVGNGTVDAETLRVTIASDTTGLLSVDDNGGSLTVDSGGVALLVDGSAVTQPVSAASLPLPTGAATAANQLADGHNVTVDNASGGSAVNIQDGGNSITVDGTGGNTAGDVANDAADSGNPVKIGAHATNSIEGETQVANNDRVDIKADLNGVLLTRNGTTLEELISARQTNTDGSEDAVTNFAAGGAGIHNYITAATISNSSATGVTVDLLDGTGGTAMWTFPAAANFGGSTLQFDPPLKQPTANTGLFFDPSAAVSTITVSLNGYQAQG